MRHIRTVLWLEGEGKTLGTDLENHAKDEGRRAKGEGRRAKGLRKKIFRCAGRQKTGEIKCKTGLKLPKKLK
jgi:hypothetical protein